MNEALLGILLLTFLFSFISTFPSWQDFAVDTSGNTTGIIGGDITIITPVYCLSYYVAIGNKERC